MAAFLYKLAARRRGAAGVHEGRPYSDVARDVAVLRVDRLAVRRRASPPAPWRRNVRPVRHGHPRDDGRRSCTASTWPARRRSASTSPTRSAATAAAGTERAFGIVGVNAGLPRVLEPVHGRPADLGGGVERSDRRSRRSQVYVNTANPGLASAGLADVRQQRLGACTVARHPTGRLRLPVRASTAPRRTAPRSAPVTRPTTSGGSTSRPATAGTPRSREEPQQSRCSRGWSTALEGAGIAEVGLYSTAHQWGRIVGSGADRQQPPRPAELAGRRRRASVRRGACARCAPLTAGRHRRAGPVRRGRIRPRPRLRLSPDARQRGARGRGRPRMSRPSVRRIDVSRYLRSSCRGGSRWRPPRRGPWHRACGTAAGRGS